MASRIAEIEHANVDIVKLAALLHDVDDIKLSPNTHNNKDNARKFLNESNIDENTISNLSSKLFSNISFQFLGGAVSGAAIVALLNQFLENQNSNKE